MPNKDGVNIPETPVGFSNLIFDNQKRGASALSFTTSPQKKIHFGHRKNTSSVFHKDFTIQKCSKTSRQKAKANNYVSIINLIGYNTFGKSPDSKKSNKKITLTNVEKYYQFCVKKVRTMFRNEQKHQNNLANTEQTKKQKLPVKPIIVEQLQNQQNNLERSTSFDFAQERSQTRTSKFRKVSLNLNQMVNLSKIRTQSQQFTIKKIKERPSLSKDGQTTYKNRYNKRGRKDEFVLDAWESQQNLVQEHF